MSWLYDNMTAVLVALAASALTWLFGGTRSDWLEPAVPWMLLFLAEAIFAFPQRHAGESVYEARERTWRTLRRDPVVWLSVVFLVLLAVPFVNVGLCPSCDAQQIAAGACAEPPFKGLPFCVNVTHHLNVYLWFAVALFCAIAVRDALCSRGKRLVLSLVVWNGLVLAVFGFVQVALAAEGPYGVSLNSDPKLGDFFATWGYPNMAGDYFTTLFGLSIALWRRALDDESAGSDASHRVTTAHRVFWRKHLYLLPAATFYAAALATLSRAAIMLVTVLAALYFFHAFRSFAHGLPRAARVKRGTIAFGLAAVLVFFAVLATPEAVQREVGTLDADAVLTRISGKGEYHNRVAVELWKDHPAFGCGGWGYKHFCVGKMTEKERKSLQMVGGINVHNDWLQFLAEHGLVGLLLLLVLLAFLVKPVFVGWSRLYHAAKFLRGKARPPSPVAVFALPAPAFCALLTALATAVHSFADCPLRSAAVLTLFFIVLPACAGFLPPGAVASGGESGEG